MPGSENQSVIKTITFTNNYQGFFTRNGNLLNAIEINGVCATIAPSSREEDTLSPKKTYLFQNRQVPGQDIPFEPTAEPWGQYKLADGSEVKVKIVLINAARLDEFTEQGDPLYQFQFQHIVTIVSPDSLKRKPQ